MLNEIKKLKNIAEIGLLYAQDPYDIERYQEIKALSLQMLSELIDKPLSLVNDFYTEIKDYPTPKVDIRCLVLNEKKQVLLVQERNDNHWALPGGWADIGLSPSEVAAKEVFEEAGLRVNPQRLLAVLDKKCHPHPSQAHYIYKLIFYCEYLSGELTKGFDILDTRFFDLHNLPQLSENRILASQILLAIRQLENNSVYFD